ncbi:MAG: hypothetical protein IJ282_05895 [Lachnospiraceae bacterium]|nr:hypothetical protein [Lachnospiraceae bacterium]
MALMDEFKSEREAVKQKSFREKVNYFVYYYKWHVIAAVAIFFLLFALVRETINSKELSIFGLFLNASSMTLDSPEEFEADFCEYAGIDTQKHAADFEHTFRMGPQMDSAGLEANQMIMVYLAAGDIDVMAMDTFNFNKYSYNSAYADLRNYLTEEELETYKDYLFYIDEGFLDEIERIKKGETLDYTIEYPDFADPASMENPIPVGINLKASPKFQEYYTYGKEEAYLGIVLNAPHPDICAKLLDFLFEK